MKTHGWLGYGLQGGKGFWVIEAQPDVMIRLRRVFPRAHRFTGKQIVLTDTPETARDIEWVLERWPLLASAEVLLLLKRQADAHRATEEAVLAILSGERQPQLPREPARTARDYQAVAAELARETGRLLLVDDLGLGKSMSALLVLLDPAALPALVVCLTHLPMQWVGEVEKTLPWLRTHVVRSLQPYDVAKRCKAEPDVLLMPYSKLRGWGDHLAGRVRTVIFDEAQELRRRESQKWEAAEMVAADALFRIGLTATPVYNYGGEIHNVLSVLAPGVLGSKEEFGREWCGGEWSDKARVSDPAALGTYLRDQGVMLRRTRKEVGRELPPVVRVPHSIDTDDETYEALSGEILELAELIVSRAGSRQELWQAAGDFDWRMRHATGVAKAPCVAGFVRLLLESEERVVLYGWHRDVYEIWAKSLADIGVAFYTGTESPNQKQRSVDAFLAGDARVLAMSLRAGAGLDGLQEAAHVAVFGELDWSPGMHDQCIGRLHRDGQDESVVAYFLVSDQGSDPVMAEVLNLKRMQSEPLRDPTAPLFETITPVDHVRLLAEDVIRRRSAGRATLQR